MNTTRFAIVALICASLAACATRPSAPPPEAPKVALPPPPPSGEPGNLAGLDATALKVAFGSPAFVRKDGAVEIWRYDNPSCKAFFFLYASGTSLAVRHVETLPRGHDIAADESCLAQLRAHGSAPVS
jgi:hypothetical protein